jgi:hypothetical protein
MAIFTQDTVDSSKIESYLYELNENLTYMFNNLTPEENYSESARLIYAQRGEHLASVEVKADQIELRVENSEKHYNTSITLLSDLLSLNAETPDGSSSMELTGDCIKLTTGKFEVDAKNLKIDSQGNGTFSGTVNAAKIVSPSIEGGTIKSTKLYSIDIETASLKSADIKSGSIYGVTITGGRIDGSEIYGGDNIPLIARKGYVGLGDFIIDDSYGRNIFQSSDEVTGMSTGDVSGTGKLLLWAGWTGNSDTSTFMVNGKKQVVIHGALYYNGMELSNYIKSVVGQ